METLWETGAFAEKLRLRATCGEILPTGEILDLVAAADGKSSIFFGGTRRKSWLSLRG